MLAYALRMRCVCAAYADEPENLKHPTEDIVTAAVAAVRAVSRQYFAAMPAAWQGELVAQYVGKLDNANPAARRGFALAVGALAPAGTRCFTAALLPLYCCVTEASRSRWAP